MAEPLSSTEGRLAPHWNTLIGELTPHLHRKASKVNFETNSVSELLITTFKGDVVRRANRHRGDPVPVVPLCELRDDWEVWVGYREVWALMDRRSNLAFSSSDITVFFTVANSGSFQQIVRAEWNGLVEDPEGWSFRPENAGHPHWQIDLAQVLRDDAELEAARQLMREAEPKPFGDTATDQNPYPPWYEINRIHFASAMRPWADEIIAHGPGGLSAVRSWVVRTVRLLNVELARL